MQPMVLEKVQVKKFTSQHYKVMAQYLVEDTIQFFDAIAKIKSEKNDEASIIIKNSVDHCHLLRFLDLVKLNIVGRNVDYNIYLDCKELSSNPEWKFNSTLFFHSANIGITYSYLKFTYNIESYDFMDDPILNSFSIVFMEFYKSEINFKDCHFENSTGRKFEIIVKSESTIIFENCNFEGNFNFIFDISSNIIIK